MDNREEATAFLRRMEADHPADWRNRELWPVEDRAAYEAWERGELARKAAAEPLPVTPSPAGAPQSDGGGR